MTDFPTGTILGYPRIGPRRELKKAVESFWAGKTTAAQLEATAVELRAGTRARLVAQGLDASNSSIPESFSFYDQVLDTAVTVGAVPERFAHLRAADGSLDLAGYFTVARGEGDRAALEMTKWFDTNYHYLVPEIGPETTFALSSDRLVRQVEESRAAGFVTRPVIVGPVTFLALAKGSHAASEGYRPIERLEDILPVYAELLQKLAAAGAEWVQLDEPALVSESLTETPAVVRAAAERAYAVLGAVADRPSIFVAAPYNSLDEAFATLAAAPIEAIGVDLVRGTVPTAPAGGFPGLADKTLVGGVIDGHNIWRGDLGRAFASLEQLRELGAAAVAASTSTSLLHVPHDVTDEPNLDTRLVSWLAFADQKVAQVATLARGLVEGRAAIAADIDAASSALADRLAAPGVRDEKVRTRTAALTEGDFARGDYAAREAAQAAALGLPALPTTTIGSFPQTGEIRRARAQFTKGDITQDDYDGFLRDEIRRVVELQEDLGIDVLVHGEPERNDMVQYFAE
ncbi:MAG TPA: 5-methyltetrahydropteroyltriglutamate--homocysteine S-methyltransferase, partial [Microbacteriaceae bacterium]|nr:5-methyltetrahydropteroyltriglutamate--homocysteine S-methyltransferase [Microbacteriaceae bacterium]